MFKKTFALSCALVLAALNVGCVQKSSSEDGAQEQGVRAEFTGPLRRHHKRHFVVAHTSQNGDHQCWYAAKSDWSNKDARDDAAVIRASNTMLNASALVISRAEPIVAQEMTNLSKKMSEMIKKVSTCSYTAPYDPNKPMFLAQFEYTNAQISCRSSGGEMDQGCLNQALINACTGYYSGEASTADSQRESLARAMAEVKREKAYQRTNFVVLSNATRSQADADAERLKADIRLLMQKASTALSSQSCPQPASLNIIQ